MQKPHQRSTVNHGKWRNAALTALLLGLVVVLGMILGKVLFGGMGVFLVGALGLLAAVAGPRLSTGWTLRLLRARRLEYGDSPRLMSLFNALVKAAGLSERPALYAAPVGMPNAFTLSVDRGSAVVLTTGLLSQLNTRELAGVLAHELSHIKSGDLKLIGLADSFRRLTHTFAAVGVFSFLLMFPLMLFGAPGFSFWGLLLVIASPTLSLLLELALSRTREFEADRITVELTGDPEGFISALTKIDGRNLQLRSLLFGPVREPRRGGLLRTHPSTDERIRRIRRAGPWPAPTHAALFKA